ncbi:MAG TPA: helix-turn-helix domain-containing protein [Rhodanobacteraceae bacterium]
MASPQENITSNEAAALLHRAPITLERWRRRRVGPPFLRVCGRVLYRVADIEEWLEKNRVEPMRDAA